MDRFGYLAGRDRDRAADINAAFVDPEVDAVLRSAEGGAPAACYHLSTLT